MTDTKSILRGPADADHYRVKVGRYGDRWYADPLPTDEIAEATDASWPAFSIVKKASGKDWSFVSLGRVADALDRNPRIADPDDAGSRYDKLSKINQRGLEQAGDRGTNIHRYFEQGLRGQKIGVRLPGEPGEDYLPAVHAFFDQYQPELVAAELVCIHRTLNGVGYGGTCDAVVKIEGQLGVIDWKSRRADGEHGAYPEEAAQVAAYAGCEYVILDGPTRYPLHGIDAGLIVSVKPDGCRLYPIDLDKAWTHWEALHAWWVARRSEREAIGKPWAPRKPVKAPPQAEPIYTRGDLPPRPRTSLPPAEGPEMAEADVSRLREHVGTLGVDGRFFLGGLTRVCDEAGYSLNMKAGKPTLRRWSIARACYHLAKLEADDDVARALIAAAMKSEDPLMPSVTIGQALVALTIEEADRLSNLARDMESGAIALDFSEDGVPSVRVA